jgi:hypothetical protein
MYLLMARIFALGITLQKFPNYLIKREALAHLFAHFNCIEKLLVFEVVIPHIGRVVDGGVPILIWGCN